MKTAAQCPQICSGFWAYMYVLCGVHLLCEVVFCFGVMVMYMYRIREDCMTSIYL